MVPDSTGRPSVFRNIDDVLDLAIFEETEAVNLYTQLAEMTKDPETRKHVVDFIAEEEKHLEKFKRIKEEGTFKKINKSAFNFINENETIQDVVDARKKIDIGPDISLEDAFKFVILKEKGAYLIYSGLAENTNDEEVRSLLEFFAMEEAKHKLQFEIAYERLKKKKKIY